MESSSHDKCSCEKTEAAQESDGSVSDSHSPLKEKKKLSLYNLGLNLRRGRSLHFKSKRTKSNESTSNASNANPNNSSNLKKSPKWGLKFNCIKKESKADSTSERENCCKCTIYRQVDEQNTEPENTPPTEMAPPIEKEPTSQHEIPPLPSINETAASNSNHEASNDHIPEVSQVIPAIVRVDNVQGNRGIYESNNIHPNTPFMNLAWFHMTHEDCDEAARRQRAREIEQGVEAPSNLRTIRRLQVLCSDENEGGVTPRRLELVCPPVINVDSIRALFQNHVTLRFCPLDAYTGCHTQVDFMHCLVPDLLDITNCSFYWGKMDRYEAERLLDGKPEGTFLLRDSAQEEFLFSVSFRKYGRSLHARIEQWNHKFSFDSHDPGVYTSDTVCGLIEHYKDPSSCMFFEPMLTWPLHRNITFSLQHLCRATIVNRLTYDDVNQLQLPKTLKSYLKEYHYRQKVRVERFDDDVQWLDLRNVPP